MKDLKYTLQSFFFFLYIDEPFEWTKIGPGPDNVYFKSQNPYNYAAAKEYCNRQGDKKSTGNSTHASQLWYFDNTTKKLINKDKFWTSDPNVTWNIADKPNHRHNNMVSIQKITEKKELKIQPDDDNTTTNIPKEKGVIKKAGDALKKVAKKIYNYVVAFGQGNDVGVLGDGKEQLWKKTVEPSSGGYFTLENLEAQKVLTAVDGSFQLRSTFLLLVQPVKKWLN